MRFLAVALFGAALAFAVVSYGGSASSRCVSGQASGFVALSSDPPYLAGTLPSRFSDDPRFFSRRFNCTGRSAQARRVDLGVYEVRFPGLGDRMALASAVSDEGVSASVRPLGGGVFRIALRGPLSKGDIASRRDVPFAVAVF